MKKDILFLNRSIGQKNPKFQIPNSKFKGNSQRNFNNSFLGLGTWDLKLGTLLFLIPLSLIPYISFAQQDPLYSQYMFNQLALNPAYAGSREALAISFSKRNQWMSIDGAPTTHYLSVQKPFGKKKIGLGAELFSDKLGPKNTTALLFSYSYRFSLGKGRKLAFGLRMGAYNYSFNWSKMNYKDLNDIYYINNENVRTSKFTGTGDFGMYYYSRTFYWGLGMTHLNQGKITEVSTGDSSARQFVHYFMPAGQAFQVGKTVINPTLLIKGVSGVPSQMDWGINVLINETLWIGISVRSKYGLVFLTQCRISDKMKVGLSLDHGINKIGALGKGTFEIMIGYDMNIQGTKMIMPRYL